ncbi:MAG: GntR family transcriptional regulator [Promethearchaeota archaeon]
MIVESLEPPKNWDITGVNEKTTSPEIPSHIKLAKPSDGTLSNELYKHLKKEIITCRLQPGEMIFERNIRRKYGVSRTPVREALKTLIQEGLVESVPGTCYLVAPITTKDVVELFDMRRILEEAAALRAAERVTEEQLEALERLMGKPHSLDDEESLIRWYETNTEFHVSIAKVSENDRLVQALRGVLEDISRVYLLDLQLHTHTAELVETHGKILAALRQRDGRSAAELTLVDIDKSERLVQQLLSSSGSAGIGLRK